MKVRLLILAAALILTVWFYSTSAQTNSVTYTNCTVVVSGGTINITCPTTPPPPPLVCTVSTAPNPLQVGVAFTLDVSGQCSGGTKPYTFTAVGFPAGITMSPAGVISGTPQTVGTVLLTWQVTDSGKTAQTFEQRIILDAAKKPSHPTRPAGR